MKNKIAALSLASILIATPVLNAQASENKVDSDDLKDLTVRQIESKLKDGTFKRVNKLGKTPIVTISKIEKEKDNLDNKSESIADLNVIQNENWDYTNVGDLNGDGLVDTLDLIEYHSKEIIAVGRATGIYPSVIAAQMVHESGRNMNGLAKNARNYFGIKYFNKLDVYGAVPYDHPTFEIVNGSRVNTSATFAKFPDFKSSLNAFADMYWNGLYEANVKASIYDLQNTTNISMIEAINQSPYASDPSLGKQLIDCINIFGFEKYDKIAYPNGRLRAGKLNGTEVYSIGDYPDDGYNLKDITWRNPSNF